MTAVEAYFEGINAERYDDVGALFAPDGVLVAPGVAPRRGPAEVADYFRAALRLYPEHYDDPTRIIDAGTTVTVEIHFTGRLENGHPLEFDAVDVFDLDGDGRIARLSSWYDSHAVRKALRAALEVDGRAAAR
jgi:ketosteroid isomerase-like protein